MGGAIALADLFGECFEAIDAACREPDAGTGAGQRAREVGAEARRRAGDQRRAFRPAGRRRNLWKSGQARAGSFACVSVQGERNSVSAVLQYI